MTGCEDSEIWHSAGNKEIAAGFWLLAFGLWRNAQRDE
jgi:hypothetical protein